MSSSRVNRRSFLTGAATSLGVVAAGASLGFDPVDEMADNPEAPPRRAPMDPDLPARPAYTGPNVVLVRFGGGVRRLETITEPEKTYCPFIYHELGRKQGVIFNNVDIEAGQKTSHGEGTLYLLCGEYRRYHDVHGDIFGDKFEPVNPTLFEYLRSSFNVPAHQALIVNHENRIGEEFYTFSNHNRYGINYRSTVISLFRFKLYLARRQLDAGGISDHRRRHLEHELRKMERLDYRVRNRNSETVSSPELNAFWEKWRGYWGDSGFVNPRGDRLMTTLSLWAMEHLKPRLMMVNYTDPDYVHWGIANQYTRSISIIDEGVREIYNAVQSDRFAGGFYRDNTIFVIVPDCGRDNNRCMAVPFQHHFGSRSSHEIFTVVAGPRQLVPRAGTVNSTSQPQIAVTRTIGDLMGFGTQHVRAGALPL